MKDNGEYEPIASPRNAAALQLAGVSEPLGARRARHRDTDLTPASCMT